jgi:hypothetical protein
MSVEIRDFRLSLIWVETFLDLLAPGAPSQAPLAFLGRSYTYEPVFAQLLEGKRPEKASDLSLPWINIVHNNYWKCYFEGRVPPNARTCWKALVPLRGKLPAEPTPSWLPGRVLMESFFYPHGIAFVVTATCQGSLTLEEMTTMARRVRQTGKYPVQWLPGGSGEAGLKTLADRALTALRTQALGPAAAPGSRAATPFTVLTVVRGAGVYPSAPFPAGGEAQRALEAVTRWSSSYRFDPLPGLDEVRLKSSIAPDSHIIYARRRGRAVWWPGYFTCPGGDMHTLSCYHRNLVFTSLTVESLAGLITETAKHLRQGRAPSPAHSECAQRAAGILGRLYGGAASTYRSWHPTTHIQQNGFVAAVNQVRRLFNMTDLA